MININFNVVIGILMMIISAVIITISIILSFKGSMKTRGDILDRKQKLYNKIDYWIIKIKPLDKIKRALQLKYGVINSSTEKKNKITAINTILYISIISIILIFIISRIVKVWYMSLLVSLGVAVFPYIVLFSILNMKLDKLKKQFPDAVNMFITKYTSDKNKERALQRTYIELENPIRYEFKRLATMMANQSNINEAIQGFCKRIDYVWVDIFGELLLLNHNTVKDIGDELNELSLLMAEDQALEAHKKSEINATISINVIVALFVLVAMAFNIAAFKAEAINIYFHRYVGIVSVSISLITIIVCLSLTFYFEKN